MTPAPHNLTRCVGGITRSTMGNEQNAAYGSSQTTTKVGSPQSKQNPPTPGKTHAARLAEGATGHPRRCSLKKKLRRVVRIAFTAGQPSSDRKMGQLHRPGPHAAVLHENTACHEGEGDRGEQWQHVHPHPSTSRTRDSCSMPRFRQTPPAGLDDGGGS